MTELKPEVVSSNYAFVSLPAVERPDAEPSDVPHGGGRRVRDDLQVRRRPAPRPAHPADHHAHGQGTHYIIYELCDVCGV